MRWAIGDIQGCYRTFVALLEQLDFEPTRDEIWLAGDLVNRGTGSLDVLRFCRRHDASVRAVLGNHDLHLLARAHGVARPGKRDTLDAVLSAPDRADVLEWLRHRPLLHATDHHLMFHAGLLPEWTVADAIAAAREAELVLRGPDAERLLRRMRRARQHQDLAIDAGPIARAAATVAVLTRLRACDTEGRLTNYSGRYENIPRLARAWFDCRLGRPDGLAEGRTLVCGHWASLGLRTDPEGLLALDTGCVWGHALTAVDLDGGRVVQQPTVWGDRPSDIAV
ncbi:MAG: Bis(5-nucleosyl)-tetraphosphatase, symmetrical [Pseudomonadota bacterium]